MKDDELYAKAIDEDDDELEFRLYPIGENEFGRKGGMIRLTVGKDTLHGICRLPEALLYFRLGPKRMRVETFFLCLA